jgi:hypothetical protein
MPKESSPREMLDMPKECAKDLIRDYVVDGWSLDEIVDGHMSCNRDAYAAQIGAVGGRALDQTTGKMRRIGRTKILVTRCLGAQTFVRFSVAEIMAEIIRETPPKPKTLADVFQEEEARKPAETTAPQRRKRAVLRRYYAGQCRNPLCGRELGKWGWIEADGGRNRLYCDDNCKVAAHRYRKCEAKRAQTLLYHGDLRDYWQANDLHGEVVLKLQAILLDYGKDAALAATETVLLALAGQQEAERKQQVALIEQTMLGGQDLNFEEVLLDEFRIHKGWENWCEFTSHAPLASLRILSNYIQARYEQRHQALAGRKRLHELSNALLAPEK